MTQRRIISGALALTAFAPLVTPGRVLPRSSRFQRRSGSFQRWNGFFLCYCARSGSRSSIDLHRSFLSRFFSLSDFVRLAKAETEATTLCINTQNTQLQLSTFVQNRFGINSLGKF